jgi:CubicO group peptidase (beta-lactamase class C family)
MALIRTAVAIGAALAVSASASAATNIDRIFAPWSKSTTPGCAAAVSLNGKIVVERAYGMANLEHNIPITANTIFETGSVAKQFTAAAVVLLAQDGKLSLDDSVRQYVPELGEYADAVTIRQLLNHTSGLRDWGTVVEIAGWPRGARAHTHAHVLEVLARQRELNFPAGTDWSYTNSGYNLAAIIVERVSGKPLPEFTRERIFAPLGMTNSSWRDDYARVVPRRATAYAPDDERGKYRAEMHYENIYGNCCMLTTVRDLLRWNDNFTSHRVGGAELIATMESTGKLASGADTGYAMGLIVREVNGLREVSHGGVTGGYKAFLSRYPEQHLSVALLCNNAAANPPDLAKSVAEAFLDVEKKAVPRIELTTQQLAPRAGLYRDPATDRLLRIHLKDGALRLGFGDSGIELVPIAANRFRAGESPSEIVFENGGARLVVEGRRNALYLPVEPFVPAKPSEFAGEYQSDEAAILYVISERAGRVTLRIPPNEAHALEPTFADAFRLGRSTLIHFTRDATGAIDGFDLKATFDMSSGTARVEKMRFVKQ